MEPCARIEARTLPAPDILLVRPFPFFQGTSMTPHQPHYFFALTAPKGLPKEFQPLQKTSDSFRCFGQPIPVTIIRVVSSWSMVQKQGPAYKPYRTGGNLNLKEGYYKPKLTASTTEVPNTGLSFLSSLAFTKRPISQEHIGFNKLSMGQTICLVQITMNLPQGEATPHQLSEITPLNRGQSKSHESLVPHPPRYNPASTVAQVRS